MAQDVMSPPASASGSALTITFAQSITLTHALESVTVTHAYVLGPAVVTSKVGFATVVPLRYMAPSPVQEYE